MRVVIADSLENDADACRELWQEVVLQAVDEAQGTGDTSEAARLWLFNPLQEKDFLQVCEFAGLDPEAVRARVNQNGRRAFPLGQEVA